MHKSIFMTTIALVAFAAVPAIASASPVLTEGGVALKPTAESGGKILATNSGNIVLTTSIGNVTCTKSTLTGSLLKNSGSHIEGTAEKATFTNNAGGDCSSTFPFNPTFEVVPENLHWCITSATAGAWSIRGGGCNEAGKNLRFTLKSSAGYFCTFERATVTGTYVTGVSPATLKVGSSQTFGRTAGADGVCPPSGTLDGGWNLYTDNAEETPLLIS
jgi:hypothetical protein